MAYLNGFEASALHSLPRWPFRLGFASILQQIRLVLAEMACTQRHEPFCCTTLLRADLQRLISGMPPMSLEALQAVIKFEVVGVVPSRMQLEDWFIQALGAFSEEERSKFVFLVTETWRLPTKDSPITVIFNGATSKGALPQVSTCHRQLLIPCYRSAHALREKLKVALNASDDILAEQLRSSFPNARECKACGFGPIDHIACDDLLSHQNEQAGSGSVRINNACPQCGWFSANIAEWPQWSGRIK
jgi:hypothetical protein